MSTAAVVAIDAEIGELEAQRADIDATISEARAKRTSVTETIARLSKARSLLRAEPIRRGASTGNARKAGPAAMEAVRKTLADDLDGRATQASITAKSGVNSGQVSSALRALTEAGVIRPTGVMFGRTKEFEVVA